MARSTFVDLTQQPIIGIALAMVAVLGLTSVVMEARRERRPAPLALPAGLLVGFVGFAWLTAVASPENLPLKYAGIDRYVHIAAVLLLPLVGLGGAFLAEYASVLGVLSIGLLVAGIPGNIQLLDDYPNPIFEPRRGLILAAAHSRFLGSAPPDLRIAATPYVPELGPTVGWLRSNVAAGRIPEPRRSTRLDLAADGVLVLQQHVDADHKPSSCPQREAPWAGRVSGGDAIRFDGTIRVFLVDGVRSAPFSFDSANRSVVTIASGPVDVVVEGNGGIPPRVC